MSTTTLQPAGQWAREEFAFADLGEPRLNKRLVKVATNLAASPGGTLPQAFPDWAELKAAYRFFDNRAVDFERVLQPHLERTRRACREPGEYLIIEDSSNLDFSRHRKTQDLGVIGDGNGRGFELHSALAVRVEGGPSLTESRLSLGTPQYVTLQELRVEMFMLADDASEATLVRLGRELTSTQPKAD